MTRNKGMSHLEQISVIGLWKGLFSLMSNVGGLGLGGGGLSWKGATKPHPDSSDTQTDRHPLNTHCHKHLRKRLDLAVSFILYFLYKILQITIAMLHYSVL